MASCIIGGTTINSWAGVGLAKEDVDHLIKMVGENKHAVKRWRQCSLLVIDEVSMMDSKLCEKLDGIGQAIRNSTSPFGGIQLALCGDFFQLPPVGLSKASNMGFCFQTGAWARSVDETVILSQVFRQRDTSLSTYLNQIRVGEISREFETILTNLKPKPVHELDIQPTRLFARNADADRVNQECLQALKPQSMHVYKAYDWCQSDRFKSQLDAGPAASELRLVVGAQGWFCVVVCWLVTVLFLLVS